MPKVKVGDINMYYEVHGRGEPLVLISGGTGRSTLDKARMRAYNKKKPPPDLTVYSCFI